MLRINSKLAIKNTIVEETEKNGLKVEKRKNKDERKMEQRQSKDEEKMEKMHSKDEVKMENKPNKGESEAEKRQRKAEENMEKRQSTNEGKPQESTNSESTESFKNGSNDQHKVVTTDTQSAEASDSTADSFERQGNENFMILHISKESQSHQTQEVLTKGVDSESCAIVNGESLRESADVDINLSEGLDVETYRRGESSDNEEKGIKDSAAVYLPKCKEDEENNDRRKQEKDKDTTISEDMGSDTLVVADPNSVKGTNLCLYEGLFAPSVKFLAVHSIDIKHCVILSSFARPLSGLVYAISSRAEPSSLSSLSDAQTIKHVLFLHDLRNVYLEYEHFRLATFSLSPNVFELGQTLQLAAEGYYFDIDGHVKCANCGCTYNSEPTNGLGSHNQNCIVQHSSVRVGITIADYYGASSLGWLLIYGQYLAQQNLPQQNLPEQDDVGHCIDIRPRREYFRIGSTEQATYRSRVTPVAPEEEQYCDYDTAAGAASALQDETNQYSYHVSTQQESEDENQRTTSRSREGHGDQRPFRSRDIRDSLWSYYGKKAVKKPKIRRNTKDVKPKSTLLTENARLRSRTQCCVCKRRRCNIVFKPCGHFVICDHCIRNTTICPKCEAKIDTAYTVNNE